VAEAPIRGLGEGRWLKKYSAPARIVSANIQGQAPNRFINSNRHFRQSIPSIDYTRHFRQSIPSGNPVN
jgi:hypothetical protein